jgi:acetate kinase
MKVLVLNSGSSSQKARIYDIGEALPADPPPALWERTIDWTRAEAGSRAQAVEQLIRTSWSDPSPAIAAASEIDVVGHRIVHGGARYQEPAIVDAEVKAAIRGASAFAPLHNGAELDGIEIVERLLGPVPQVAVFDTGFHRNLPPAASVYPGPYAWFERGIHRYGFHGINHQYCAARAGRLLRTDVASLKLVTCHLGNGCSLAAIQGGRGIDTTMGFTPLEGLMMGTRSGSIDPGILSYLLRQGELRAEDIDEVLNRQSGLLGVSGISGDMREVLAARKAGHQRAALALDIYVHRLRAAIGAMVAALGGIDALVFTGGVGENAPDVRAAACANLECFGLALDPDANAGLSPDADIAALDSPARILVIRAQEDWAIAAECWKRKVTPCPTP